MCELCENKGEWYELSSIGYHIKICLCQKHHEDFERGEYRIKKLDELLGYDAGG